MEIRCQSRAGMADHRGIAEHSGQRLMLHPSSTHTLGMQTKLVAHLLELKFWRYGDAVREVGFTC